MPKWPIIPRKVETHLPVIAKGHWPCRKQWPALEGGPEDGERP